MIDFRYYLITDRQRCAPRSLQSVVREACDAGVRAVQLRERDLTTGSLEEFVARLVEITRPRNAKLIVNRSAAPDTPDDAFFGASLGADGFHFPDNADFPHELRRRFPQILVGVSTHSAQRAIVAAAEGSDFITFGPIFDTPAKRAFGPPQGLENLRRVCETSRLPVFAIGGITPENAAACIEAGAHGVAGIGSVMSAGHVADAVRAFEEAIGSL